VSEPKFDRATLVAAIEAVRANGDAEKADVMQSILDEIDKLDQIERDVEQGVREGWLSPEYSGLAKWAST
jgi:hypothetical protein